MSDIYKCPVTARYYDPLTVRRTLIVESAGKINELLAQHRSTDELVSSVADEEVIRCARIAFNLEPVNPKDGNGVPDALVLDALSYFNRWLLGKDERGQNSPSSAECTVCPRT